MFRHGGRIVAAGVVRDDRAGEKPRHFVDGQLGLDIHMLNHPVEAMLSQEDPARVFEGK